MRKNILLVDDEQVFHFLNSKVIELSGFECKVQTAANGQEGIDIISGCLRVGTAFPDVIFIDLNMPVMDGFEFIRFFQSMEFPQKEKTTLVVLTSSVDLKEREIAIGLGIKHFISKPLTKEEFEKVMFDF